MAIDQANSCKPISHCSPAGSANSHVICKGQNKPESPRTALPLLNGWLRVILFADLLPRRSVGGCVHASANVGRRPRRRRHHGIEHDQKEQLVDDEGDHAPNGTGVIADIEIDNVLVRFHGIEVYRTGAAAQVPGDRACFIRLVPTGRRPSRLPDSAPADGTVCNQVLITGISR